MRRETVSDRRVMECVNLRVRDGRDPETFVVSTVPAPIRNSWKGRVDASLAHKLCIEVRLNPCKYRPYSAKHRGVSASAFIVNPWVGQFRGVWFTRGNKTVLEQKSRGEEW